MLSNLYAARHTALGSSVCHLVSAGTRAGALPGACLECSTFAQSEFFQADAHTWTKPKAAPTLRRGLDELCPTSLEVPCLMCNGTAIFAGLSTMSSLMRVRSRQISTAGALPGHAAWRLPSPPVSTSGLSAWPVPSIIAALSPPAHCIHTSTAASGAAGVSAAAAAAAVKQRQASHTAAVATTGRSPYVVRQQPLSPHAYEFQRRFFQLVNSCTTEVAVASSEELTAAEAVAHTTNSQAIRMLLAWLEEGRETAATEHQQQHSTTADAVTAPSLPPFTVAPPYRLEQQIIDRAMDILWRLFQYRRELETNHEASGVAASSAVNSPMGLLELLNAAQILAAAAPAMNLTFKRHHYELLLALYGKRALLDPHYRRGLAQRMLAVRQQMVQEHMPVSQMALHVLLQAVRTDSLLNNPTKLAWAIRLVERDLQVVTMAATKTSFSSRSAPAAALRAESAAAASGTSAILPLLRNTLTFLLRIAAQEADWAAYRKLEAVLVSRTRLPPPYEVLLDGIQAASSSNGSNSQMALGFLSQMEQLEAKGLGPRPQQWREGAEPHDLQGKAVEKGEHSQVLYERQQQQERLLRQEWWHEQEAEQRLEQELRSLRRLVHVGAEQGEEQLARKAYDRMRRLFWRDHPCVVSVVVKDSRAKAKAEAKAANVDSVAEVAAAEPRDAAEGNHDEGADEFRWQIFLEAAQTCPAPPDATLELLALSCSRGDWAAVMDHVTALAQLQSFMWRTDGRVAQILIEDPGRMREFTSAYGGLGPLSEALIRREEDTVAYYTELLQRVSAAAAAGAAEVFSGSPIPFGPPLRAAAARADLASVSAIVRQMRELHCNPGPDSYAAVMEASVRAGKPDRVPGLLDMMLEEKLIPTGPVWEVQLRAATDAGDVAALQAVAERALALVEANGRAQSGVADISVEVLAAAVTIAEARVDSRTASAVKLLRLRSEELRLQRAERQQERAKSLSAYELRPEMKSSRRIRVGELLRLNAVSLRSDGAIMEPRGSSVPRQIFNRT